MNIIKIFQIICCPKDRVSDLNVGVNYIKLYSFNYAIYKLMFLYTMYQHGNSLNIRNWYSLLTVGASDVRKIQCNDDLNHPKYLRGTQPDNVDWNL